MFKFLKGVLILLFLLLQFLNLKAQTNAGARKVPLLQKDSLIQDLIFLKGVLEEAHPSLYRYVSKDSMEVLFNSIEKKIEPQTLRDFRILLQKYVASIHSGHTYISPSPSSYSGATHFYFPFLVAVRNERLMIYRALEKSYDKYVGYEISAIQGEPATSVLENVRHTISGEGHSTKYQDYKIERTMAFINVLYGMHAAIGKYNLELRDNKGNIIKETVPNYFYKRVDTSFASYIPKELNKFEEMVKVSYPDSLSSSALLVLKGFAYNYRESKSLLAETFKVLKSRKISNLIIDVRGNKGGSLGSTIEVLRYLIPESFYAEFDSYAPVAVPSFSPHIFKGTGYALDKVPFEKRKDGGYTLKSSSSGKIPPYKDLVFNGKVYLLTDGGTFSAGSLFASCLKSNRKVISIGSETGGMESGLDTSPFLDVQLPYSKLVLHYPVFYTTIKQGENKGFGVVPDIEVEPTPFELFFKSDPVLRRVKQMINGTQ
ncbi:MAG: hypothetical protein H7Y13_13905 [Sphingobacteriaceae bacterium]|nr:hypothetical protein [Sphingobacteriaceae bacterium]